MERFIEEQQIKCAPIYYDADGKFHVERRLGCVICPLAADNGIGGYKKYPKLLRQACSASNDYLLSHPDSKSAKYFQNGHELMMKRLFFKTIADWDNVMGDSLFPELRPNAKEYLENYFKIEL